MTCQKHLDTCRQNSYVTLAWQTMTGQDVTCQSSLLAAHCYSRGVPSLLAERGHMRMLAHLHQHLIPLTDTQPNCKKRAAKYGCDTLHPMQRHTLLCKISGAPDAEPLIGLFGGVDIVHDAVLIGPVPVVCDDALRPCIGFLGPIPPAVIPESHATRKLSGTF